MSFPDLTATRDKLRRVFDHLGIPARVEVGPAQRSLLVAHLSPGDAARLTVALGSSSATHKPWSNAKPCKYRRMAWAEDNQPVDLLLLARRAHEQYRAVQAAIAPPRVDRKRLEKALLPLQETVELLLILTGGIGPPDDEVPPRSYPAPPLPGRSGGITPAPRRREDRPPPTEGADPPFCWPTLGGNAGLNRSTHERETPAP